MSGQYDGGIVEGYVTRFMQIGVKAQAGQQVDTLMDEAVSEARQRIQLWKTGEPETNIAKLIGRLRLSADLMAHTSPLQAKALMDAAALLADKPVSA